MGDISRGIATAALTLQSVIMQALVAKGALTRAEALGVVDKSLDAVTATPASQEAVGVAAVASACLEQVREGLQVSAAARQ
jgi:hypothetical protein